MITRDEAAAQLAEHQAREEIIARIVAAARRPCPAIRPTLHGGFAWVMHDGSATYGKRYQSEQAAREAWQLASDRGAAEFADVLRAMSGPELERQAAYWCKLVPPIAAAQRAMG
jgi:hypothetical protein